MNILLLGASGRLGGAFRRSLVDHILITPSHHDVDLTNEQSLAEFLSSIECNFIINTTAYNNVDGAEGEGHDLAIEMNVNVPERLAKFAAAKNIPFIHFSTDYVFDGNSVEGYREDDEPNPVNAYGRSKRDGELAVLREHPGATVVRVSRLFGPTAESANAKKDFVEIVKEKSKTESTILFYDTERGCPTLVDDVAEHVKTYLLDEPRAGIFHMSNSESCTWYEWAVEIVNQLHLPVTVEKRTDVRVRPAQIPQSTILLSTKLPAMRSWREALKEYLK